MGRLSLLVIAGAAGCGFAPAGSGDAGLGGGDDGAATIDAPLDAFEAARPMYASSDNLLYTIDVDTRNATLVGTIMSGGNAVSIDALAYAGGKLLGIPASGDLLYVIDPATAAVTQTVTLSKQLTYWALTVAPATSTTPMRIFAATNATTSNVYQIAMDGTVTPVGSFGGAMTVAGDLAWVGNVLYATLANGTCNPQCLATINTTTGAATAITKTAPGDLWGLSGYRNALWALQGSGEIDSVNVTTGALTMMVDASPINWWEGAQ